MSHQANRRRMSRRKFLHLSSALAGTAVAGPVLAAEVEAAMLGRTADPTRTATSDRNKAARALNRLERDLRQRIADLHDQLAESIAELHLHPANVERVTNTALELAHQAPLRPTTLARPTGEVDVFDVPPLTRSWRTTTMDLYDPIAEVRRPITFDHDVAADHDDVLLAHLNHRLVAQAMRTLRADTEFLYNDDVVFNLGGFEVLAEGRDVLVCASGYMVHEANKAIDLLDKAGVSMQVHARAGSDLQRREAVGRLGSEVLPVTTEDPDRVVEVVHGTVPEQTEPLPGRVGDRELADDDLRGELRRPARRRGRCR